METEMLAMAGDVDPYALDYPVCHLKATSKSVGKLHYHHHNHYCYYYYYYYYYYYCGYYFVRSSHDQNMGHKACTVYNSIWLMGMVVVNRILTP